MTELPLIAPTPSETGPPGEVLYRKWRPQSFAEVHGHEAITRTLRNSIASGRLAHAYLLCGPRGTGKTTLGRLLAKAANCEAPVDGEPCNECQSCLAFNQGRAMDFVEQDAASHNSVDDIRQLRENVALTPMAGKRKVYLLDEVHMLSNAAVNALLKTLEEPPPHVIFVLATTDPQKMLATIISRCQRFDLKRIQLTSMVERLAYICQQEGFEIDQASLEEIARSSTGSLRDAVNALEQVVTYYGKTPTPEQVRDALGLSVDVRSGQLAKAALTGDLGEGLRVIGAVRDDGSDMRQFSRQVVKYLRGFLLAKAGATESIDLPSEMAEEVRKESANYEASAITAAFKAFGRTDFREEQQSSLPLEMALLELISGGRPAPAEVKPASERVEAPPVPRAGTSRAAAPPRERAAEPAPEANLEPGATSPRTAPRAATGGDILLEQVRTACKSGSENDKQISALLNGSCEVTSSEGAKVVLGFFHTFHLERMESMSVETRLGELFSAALGRQVTVSYEHAPRERHEASEPPKGGHLVKAAQELGARAITRSDDAEGGTDG
ncbi:MAG TPA: DNA polymerase III subunit gamma/tau [Dehalococcoidia bacterium]|nr:DNA polymerase III subunit gamma/tau [Dehalococcoidia bacterium]